MNGKLPILVVCLAIVCGLWFLSDEDAGETRNDSGRPAEIEIRRDSPNLPNAARILQNAARLVFRHETLRATMRMRVEMFGQHLVGEGDYYQLGPDAEKQMLLHLQMGTGPSNTSLRQLCNGRYLWIEKDMPSIENPGERDQAVFRVDLRTVRSHLHRQDSSVQSLFPSDALVRGGLGFLLKQISDNFEFQPAGSRQYAGRNVWWLKGTWRETVALPSVEANDQSVARAARGDGQATHAPRSVVVALGQSDGLPYRIDYFGRRPAGGDSRLTDQPIASLEILHAEFDKIIDPRMFNYKSNDFDDMTAEYLVRLGLTPGRTRR